MNFTPIKALRHGAVFKMYMTTIFFLSSIILFSCGNNINNKKGENIKHPLVNGVVNNMKVPSAKNRFTKRVLDSMSASVKNCIPYRDTVFDSQNAIHYVVMDSFYTIKVKLNGLDTLWPQEYYCDYPGKHTPRFYSRSKDAICLYYADSPDFRAFLLFYQDPKQLNKMHVREIVLAISTDLKKHIVIYQDIDTMRKVIIENYISHKKEILWMPRNIIHNEVMRAKMTDSKLILTLIGSEKQITLHR